MPAPKQAFISRPAVATVPSFVGNEEADRLRQAIQNRIGERAYRLYEQSGYQQGKDREHWLQAESETLGRGLDVRDTGSWLAVSGSLRDVPAENVQIYIDARRVVVFTKRQLLDPSTSSAEVANAEVSLVADLSADVDPATASASLKDEKLTLMVKKCHPVTIGHIGFANRH